MLPPHSSHLRKGRASETGRIYLVTTSTHLRRPSFGDFNLGRIVANALRWSDRVGRTHTWAFVVMPDHLHWLVQLKGETSLSSTVATVKGRSSHAINRRNDRRGPLWQSGFHDHALREEEDLRNIARYVVHNPVRAGLVRSIRDYPLWDACWI